MRTAKFTLEESLDRTKQMAVHRAYTKATGGQKKSPIPESVDAETNTLAPSTLTQPTVTSTTLESPQQMTPVSDGDSIVPRPKQRRVRGTAAAMQKFRVNKFDVNDHAKKAFKRATSWYAKELDKTDGLSSYQISKKVKIEFDGIGPSARTLQRYAKMGLAETSPVKPGVKSDIPMCAYNSLCVAFESYVRINQLNRRDDKLTFDKLAAKINECMNHNYKNKLLNRVLCSTAKNLDASKMEYCEDRRVRWTTYSCLRHLL